MSRRVRSLVGMRREQLPGKDYVYDVAPEGWLSSRAVAELLGVAGRSARALLHRHQVECVLVRGRGGLGLCWSPEGVMRVMEQRSGVSEGIPTGWCCVYEACAILGVRRSSLHRFEARGELAGRRVRVVTSTGKRVVVVYRRAQVRGLARRRRAEWLARVAGYRKSWENVADRRVFE